MKNKDIIKYNLKTHSKKITTIVTSTIIAISLIFIFLVSTAVFTVTNFIDYMEKNSYYIKYYEISSYRREPKGFFKEKFINEPDILGYFEDEELRVTIKIPDFQNDKIDGFTTLMAANLKILPELVDGSTEGFMEGESIICPNNYLSRANLDIEVTRKDYLNMKKFLNEDVTLEYRELKNGTADFSELKQFQKIKIGGTYDSMKIFEDDNICFASPDLIKKLNLAIYDSEQLDEQKKFYVFIDSQDAAEELKKDLIGDFEMSSLYFWSTEDIIKLGLMAITILAVSIVAIILFVYIYLKKSLIDSKEEVMLLKSLGYTNCLIKKIKLNEMYLVTGAGYVLALILYTCAFVIAKNIQNGMDPLYLRLIIGYNWFSVLLCAIGLIVLCRLIVKHSKKRTMFDEQFIKE